MLVNYQVFGYRNGIISGFSSHFLIIFDIVLTLFVGIALTTVALWSIEGCISNTLFKDVCIVSQSQVIQCFLQGRISLVIATTLYNCT